MYHSYVQNDMTQLHESDIEQLPDVHSIIEQGRQQVYAADRQADIATFWNVGRGGVLLRKNRKERVGLHTARD